MDMKRKNYLELAYKVAAIFFLILGIVEVLMFTWFLIDPTGYKVTIGQGSGYWQLADIGIVFGSSYFLFKRKKIGIVLAVFYSLLAIIA